MADTPVDDQLWQDFHDVVNMTSRELHDWLRTQNSTMTTEELPDQAGNPLTHGVLRVLAKRRTDLDAEDLAVMEQVVATVRALRGEDPDPEAGDDDWRHGLMDLGHDPLKPTG
ncbi:DUF3140 domain-containing protein [Desertihabitans brevis]|uniref:DUF3140 domain-containing protein n=1 Tax=Desertihabitans brevis TaxID=2268447 RepID=A0A367YVN3_9ACTN|nr:DUF3140 domain-containing protein [Desertihabitans brevis]RCK69031.1 DUF3140 domain-containing protein [Desertihabitans brevis]